MAPDYQRPALPQGAAWQSNQAGEAAVSPGASSSSILPCSS